MTAALDLDAMDHAALVAEVRRLRAELYGARHALAEASRGRAAASLRASDAEHIATVAMRDGLAECERLRAIVEGRTTPPTDAEIDAHIATGCKWRCTADHGFDVRDGNSRIMKMWARCARDEDTVTVITNTRWWALDAAEMPGAWPVVNSSDVVSDSARRGGD